MSNDSQKSLCEKIKNARLRDHIQTLNEPNMTSYEQTLIKITIASAKLEKELHNIIKSKTEATENHLITQLLSMIRFCFGEINDLYNDFNTVFNFIKLGLQEKLVNKDFNKFDKFFYSRYGDILMEINRIKYDSEILFKKHYSKQ